MIDRVHALPLTQQASLLRLSRSSVYYLPRPVPAARLAIMHRISRRVLAWRLSITLETELCLEAVNEALAHHGKPEIFNTDSKYASASYPWAA